MVTDGDTVKLNGTQWQLLFTFNASIDEREEQRGKMEDITEVSPNNGPH